MNTLQRLLPKQRDRKPKSNGHAKGATSKPGMGCAMQSARKNRGFDGAKIAAGSKRLPNRVELRHEQGMTGMANSWPAAAVFPEQS